MKKIVEYLEGKINDVDFFNLVYNDVDLQHILEQEANIPPYTNCGNLLLYILSGNANDISFIYNVKDALKKISTKKNIPFSYNKSDDEKYKILMSCIPQWLDVNADYFKTELDSLTNDNKKEIKEKIKEKIKTDFVSIKGKPHWLQSAQWPMEDGKPLVFVGELDITPISHDKSKVYVFYNMQKKSYTCIKQSM